MTIKELLEAAPIESPAHAVEVIGLDLQELNNLLVNGGFYGVHNPQAVGMLMGVWFMVGYLYAKQEKSQ